MRIVLFWIIFVFYFSEGLNKTEIPIKMTFVEEVWLPETNLVTVTFKLKRKSIEKFYEKQIEEMYK